VETVEALVEGGKASAGPPLGPALGPLGVNIMEVINAINERTKQFAGMKVPVKVTIDPKTKQFEIEVGTPPATALILKEVGVEKGSGSPKGKRVGNLSMDQVIKIARMKYNSLLGRDLKRKVKEIVGSCVSVGVTIEGKSPKEIQGEIDRGAFDSKFSKSS
jgi:large subunit ribosomal protein L11